MIVFSVLEKSSESSVLRKLDWYIIDKIIEFAENDFLMNVPSQIDIEDIIIDFFE